MNDEYVIINKTELLNRIEELEKSNNLTEREEGFKLGRLKELNKILSQSTPLIPEIEKSMDSLRPYVAFDDLYEATQDYITNLKLDI